MVSKRYYSTRIGKNPNARLDLPLLLKLFIDQYSFFNARGYFQEAFGYECVDAGTVSGTLGYNIEAQVFRRLRKSDLWPIYDKWQQYSEDDLFDVIEFLYDQISKPVDGFFHEFSSCGWHYQSFNTETGRQEWRSQINELLCDYKEGYELSAAGEMLTLAEKGLENLLQANLPSHDPSNVEQRVELAVLKFRRHRSSLEDRKDAIRNLADVLEFLRPKLKTVIAKGDESDLFNLANNFGIRHHNDSQKTDYDKAIWLSWMFYYYLATIHAVLRLIVKQESGAAQSGSDQKS